MAKIVFEGIEKYRKQLDRLADRGEGVIKMAVYEGAAIVVGAVKENLRRIVSEDSTGDLERSIGLAPMENDKGYVNTKIGFDGYDRNGVANQLKAAVLESGSSRQPKKPFIRPAINKTQKTATDRMAFVIENELKKFFDEN